MLHGDGLDGDRVPLPVLSRTLDAGGPVHPDGRLAGAHDDRRGQPGRLPADAYCDEALGLPHGDGLQRGRLRLGHAGRLDRRRRDALRHQLPALQHPLDPAPAARLHPRPRRHQQRPSAAAAADDGDDAGAGRAGAGRAGRLRDGRHIAAATDG